MKRFFAILMSILLMAGNAAAYELPSITEDDENVTFIIEVEGDPSLLETKLRKKSDLQILTDEILEGQAKVMSQIRREVSEDMEQGYVYTSLFNGFTVEGKKSDFEELKNIEGVKNVYISRGTPVSKPMLDNAGDISYVDSAYDCGYSGKGQVIAVIDDSCDISHDFFKAAPEGAKYSKDDIDSILKNNTLNSNVTSANQVYKSEKIPYAYHYGKDSSDTYSKTEYHGTHVSGIAAGKNGKLPDGSLFSGVAYDAQLMFMGVSKAGLIYDDKIIAALNDAALLGADVVNMSLGADYVDAATAPIYKQIADNGKKIGMAIVASAGNSARGYNEATPLAENIDYSAAGSPATTDSITAVASADNGGMARYYWKMLVGGNIEIKAYSIYDGSEFNELMAENPRNYEYCAFGTVTDFAGKNLNGKIAVVDRGDITFAEKSNNAKAAGASGILIINTDNTIISTDTLSLPAALVTKNMGSAFLNASSKTLKFIETKYDFVKFANGGKMSSFSSWGVDSSLELKPEITAPGGSIYSSYPDNKYVYLSGTSMSSPYTAGMIALAREYCKSNPYADNYNNLSGENVIDVVENVMMNSAAIIRDDNGIAYSPRLQGAGLANMQNILNGKVLITGNSGKAKVSLGEITDSFDVSFTVTNISKVPVEFDSILIELTTDGYIEQDGKNYVGDTVKVTPDSVSMPNKISLASGETSTFTANIKLNKEFLSSNSEIFKNGFFIDGFVVLDSGDDSDYASVPFTGFYGSWYDVPIFDSTAYDEGGSTLADPEKPYNTGTYLKAMINDKSFFYVGRNPVDLTIVGEKYISYSNKSGLTLAFANKNYRTISEIDFTILDSDTNVVYSNKVEEVFNKFSSFTYFFDKKVLGTLSEGEYTLRVDAVTNGSDKANDTLELPIVIDTTAPQFVSAEYNSETKTLTVSAEDNHYVSMFYVGCGENVDYIPVTETDINNGIAQKSIDLSDYDNLGDVRIGVCDYAMNANERGAKTLTDKVGVEIISLNNIEGATSARLLLRNNTEADMTADVMIAFYDEDSKMITVELKEKHSLKQGETTATYTTSCDTKNATDIKVFLWDLSSMKPIDSNKSFTISKGE